MRVHAPSLAALLFLAAACSGDPSSGTNSGEASCAEPLRACGDLCVDVAHDPAHCGGCDHACAAGNACLNGTCACVNGRVDCGGACVSLPDDAANCGACGNACVNGTACVDGSCVCPAGRTECGDACVSLADDPLHCGACDKTCGDGLRCLGGACAGQRCEGTPLLGGPPLVPGFTWLNGSTAGDLDGDGHVDLVVSDKPQTGDGGVYLVPGRGDGTFAAPTRLATIQTPGPVRIANLDGQGLPDVAVGVYEFQGRAPGLTLLLRDAAGAVEAVHFEWMLVYGLAAADLDGDGDLDLAASGFDGVGGPALRFLRNDGGGTFAWAADAITFTGSPGDLAVGDMDGDGDADLVGPCWLGVGLWRNDGNFSFSSSWCAPFNDTLSDVALADLDHDSDLDIALPGPNIGWNDGSGALSDVDQWSVGAPAHGVAVADLEGDGDPDLLLSAFDSHAASLVVIRNEVGGFVPGPEFPMPASVVDLTVADVNGDGGPDVVYSRGELGLLGVVLATDGALGGRARYPVAFGEQNWVALADLDDGRVAAVTVGRDTIAEVRAPSPAGGPIEGLLYSDLQLLGLAVGDLDGDGKPDYATAVPPMNRVALLFGRNQLVYEEAEEPVGVAFADLDADDTLDLVVAEAVDPPRLRVIWGNGFQVETSFTLLDTPVDLVGGDIDGDGRDEVLVAALTSLQAVGLDDDGALANEGFQQFVTRRPRIADLDLDGRAEVIAPNLRESEVRILRAGEGVLAPVTTLSTPRWPAAVAVADFDLDGRPDLAVLDAYGTLVLLVGRESGGFSEAGTWVAGTNAFWDTYLDLAAGDVDGDGRADLAAIGPGGLVVIGGGCVP